MAARARGPCPRASLGPGRARGPRSRLSGDARHGAPPWMGFGGFGVGRHRDDLGTGAPAVLARRLKTPTARTARRRFAGRPRTPATLVEGPDPVSAVIGRPRPLVREALRRPLQDDGHGPDEPTGRRVPAQLPREPAHPLISAGALRVRSLPARGMRRAAMGPRADERLGLVLALGLGRPGGQVRHELGIAIDPPDRVDEPRRPPRTPPPAPTRTRSPPPPPPRPRSRTRPRPRPRARPRSPLRPRSPPRLSRHGRRTLRAPGPDHRTARPRTRPRAHPRLVYPLGLGLRARPPPPRTPRQAVVPWIAG